MSITVSITPQEIETKRFAVGLRGFDQQEVTAFLQSVAADYKVALESRDNDVPPAPAPAPPSVIDPYTSFGDEVASVLRSARDAAAEIRRHAEEEAVAVLSKAREEAAATVAQAKREAEQIVPDARTRYEQLVRDEQELAGRLRTMRGDIESALERIPSHAPSTQGAQESQRPPEPQQSW